VVAGAVKPTNSSDQFVVARYNTDGSLDNSFHTDGKVIAGFPANIQSANAAAVAVQTDGKILAAGNANAGIKRDLALVRFNTDGTLDSSFNTVGFVISNSMGDSFTTARAMALQPDGKIVVVGETFTSSHKYAMFAARYLADGTPDGAFGAGGVVLTAYSQVSYGNAIAIQADGKILIAGSTTNHSLTQYFTVVRCLPDGTLDDGFGTGGKVTSLVSSFSSAIEALAIQPDGKILAAGIASSGTFQAFVMARYHPYGALDNTFSTDGVVTNSFVTGLAYCYAVAVQSDQKIVLAGYYIKVTNEDFALARYNPDGNPDSTFSTAGSVTTGIATGSLDHINSMIIQPDGKIVVAGYSSTNNKSVFALARYISGLELGVLDFSRQIDQVVVYPNPVCENVTVSFRLAQTAQISVQLLDGLGRAVKAVMHETTLQAGEYRQKIEFPVMLPFGPYLLVISSGTGRVCIKLMK
jgi:uncharacterized delta-60 repeat protein